MHGVTEFLSFQWVGVAGLRRSPHHGRPPQGLRYASPVPKALTLALLAAAAAFGQGTPATATIDVLDQKQVIQGFGGALAFYTGWLTAHPYKNEIYKALFDPADGLGIDILRL